MRIFSCFGIVLVAAASAAGQDMPLSQILAPGEGWRVTLAEGKSASGLAGDGRGNVYVADPDGKQIWRIAPDGKASVFAKTEGAVHGLAVAADGRLYAAEPASKRVVLFDADGKETGKSEGEATRDLAVTRNGGMYAIIDGDKGVYLLRDGKKRQVGEVASSPGALALWADGGTLVVGDAGDKYLYAFRLRPDGDLDAREPYYPFRVRPKEPSGNAGLVFDAAGRAYATSREGVQVFDPTGRLSGVLVPPARAPLGGAAFGGADLDQLYVACGGKVYARKMLAKGVKSAGR